jgi:hypothetical protein
VQLEVEMAIEQSSQGLHMHRDILQLLHHGSELLKVLFGRSLKIHRNVDVLHAEPGNARSFIRQRFLVGVKPEIDDMPDAKRISASCSSVGCPEVVIQSSSRRQ